MKRYTMLVALFALASTLAWSAEDGAALYKVKCAGCHGAGGEGKPAMKAPALKGKSAADVTAVLTKGGKTGMHSKPFNATPDQVKAIAGYVASLK